MTTDALTWLGHAGVCLDLDGTRVLTDPVLRSHVGPLRRYGPVPPSSAWERPNLVLISHLHHDHLDLPSLRRIGSDVTVVVPAGAEPLFDEWDDVRPVVAGDSVDVGDLHITAVPAHHGADRVGTRLRAAALGYLIRSPRTSVYFAGDTGVFDGLDELRGQCDVVLLPVGGWGPSLGPEHLDPRQAAEVAARLGVGLALPIHWGTLFVPGLRALVPRLSKQPGELFRHWAGQVAGDTTVVVTEPGTSVGIP